MRVYLEAKGFPVSIDSAPYGLLARVRKGRVSLYFKTAELVYDMTATQTTVTGQVFSVTIKTENEK